MRWEAIKFLSFDGEPATLQKRKNDYDCFVNTGGVRNNWPLILAINGRSVTPTGNPQSKTMPRRLTSKIRL